MSSTTPDPWYPTEDEQLAILDEVWRDDSGTLRRVESIEPLGDPPIPVMRCRGLTYSMQYPPPPASGWTRVQPGPYIYPPESTP